MASVSPVPPPGTLRDLGVLPGRLLGTALLAGVAAFGLGHAFELAMAPAAAMAALTAAAVFATAAVVGAGLHRTVAVPVSLCTRLLGELRQGGSIGRLPEAGAPLLLQLVRALNAASQAIAGRDRSCQQGRSAVAAAGHLSAQHLDALPCAALLLDPQAGVVGANALARQQLPLRELPNAPGPARYRLAGAPATAVATAVAGRVGHAAPIQVHGIAHAGTTFSLHLAALPAATDELLVALFPAEPAAAAPADERALFTALSRAVREPLQGLCLSSAALAQMSQAPVAQWREFAGNLQREGERLRGVVDDLVVVEAIRRGEGRQHWVSHDAANLTADALRLAAGTFAAKQQRSELRVDGPTAIDCDGPRFVDALVRCLGDACARGPRGGLVQVLVQGLPDRVEVTIADDLPGLRVPQKAPPAGHTAAGASDLGLAVGRELLAAMGGSLHREDSPCGGQQLRLVVPAAASARV